MVVGNRYGRFLVQSPRYHPNPFLRNTVACSARSSLWFLHNLGPIQFPLFLQSGNTNTLVVYSVVEKLRAIL